MVRVYIIEDFEGAKLFDVQKSVLLVASIRPLLQVTSVQMPHMKANVSVYRGHLVRHQQSWETHVAAR